MPRRAAPPLTLAAAVLAVTSTIAHAQEGATLPRVRGVDASTTELVRDLVERSPTGRELVGRIEASDLIVYIRYRWFQTNSLRGRIGFVIANERRRLLAIEIAQHQTYNEQMIALAHELQHAVEIAGAPAVTDPESLSALYARIGEATATVVGAETYETRAAAEAGRRVRHELFDPAAAADANGRN